MVTRTRTGLTLLEIAVSSLVLGAVLTTVAEVTQWSAAQHRLAQRKRCALEAASTILDRLTVRDWSAITAESAAAARLSPEASRFLIDPRLVVTVDEENAERNEEIGPSGRPNRARSMAPDGNALSAKRVSVEVNWSNRTGGQQERVRLSTWVFRAGPVKAIDK